jgi:hypothetical protein
LFQEFSSGEVFIHLGLLDDLSSDRNKNGG